MSVRLDMKKSSGLAMSIEFRKCSYEYLQSLLSSSFWTLAWNIIDKEYAFSEEWQSYTYAISVDNQSGSIALINYQINPDSSVQINKFEVASKYRNRGYGEAIFHLFIERFIVGKHNIIRVIPLSEEAEAFWKKMGFSDEGVLKL